MSLSLDSDLLCQSKIKSWYPSVLTLAFNTGWLYWLDPRATLDVGQLHVFDGSKRRALEGAAVDAGPGTTVPVGRRNVRCGSARWALEGAAVGAGAGMGCLTCGEGHCDHNKTALPLLV